MTRAPACVGDGGGGVGAAVVDDDAFGDEVPRHLGDDVADGFGFVQRGDDDGDWRRHPSFFFLDQTIERLLLRMRLAKTDVDVDLGVLRIGGALIVDLVVGFECACAA